MRHPDRHAHLSTAGVSVQQVGLRVRVEEGMVLVLSVDRHQIASELAKLHRTGAASVNPGGAALPELAFEDQGRTSRVEDALDRGALRAMPHLVGATPSAQGQTERVDDERLPAAGFTGQKVEAGPKANTGLGHQREVADLELFEQPTSSGPAAGPRTTARVMSWPGGNTIGRTVSAKGFIGTSTRSRSVGSRMGPPLASAYAVDPVAVATITPSASMTPTAWPPTSISTLSIRASPARLMTASLSPIAVAMVCLFRVRVACSTLRSSTR